MIRVRFASSPTGYLHIGSARTFIFNWLYARRNSGTLILRIDDTDIEGNTEESLRSIYDGLNWLGLSWDEEHRQSDRGDLHAAQTKARLDSGHAYRDFTPSGASLLINASRAVLTGQPVGSSAFAVFTAMGRERAIARLGKA
jgi:glutamyl-tRNA synthetase